MKCSPKFSGLVLPPGD
jgi:hypothetical protein